MHGGIVLLGIFHVFLFWKKWAENVWMPMLMMLLLLSEGSVPVLIRQECLFPIQPITNIVK
jgi:hypothetical protein